MRNSFSNKLMNILAIYEPDFLVVESSGWGIYQRYSPTFSASSIATSACSSP
jgi:hypothetical protein